VRYNYSNFNKKSRKDRSLRVMRITVLFGGQMLYISQALAAIAHCALRIAHLKNHQLHGAVVRAENLTMDFCLLYLLLYSVRD